MNIGDLPNPIEANKVIRRLTDRFREKRCMAPAEDCNGRIISAHTLSCEAMLRPLSKDGHVYAVSLDPHANLDEVARIKRVGINKTSVFMGFCSKHDKELFSPLEDAPFRCTLEQCFLHAFRAVAKECYSKRRQAETILTQEDIAKIHNLKAARIFQPTAFEKTRRAYSMLGAMDIDNLKRDLDKIYKHKEWQKLRSTVIPFKETPPIVCGFVFAPDYDYSGRKLQNIEDMGAILSHIVVTVTPKKEGGGFAILSYLDKSNGAPENYIKSIISQPDISTILTWMIIRLAENFAISPVWYESLTKTQQEVVEGEFISTVGPSANKLRDISAGPFSVGSWEPAEPFDLC